MDESKMFGPEIIKGAEKKPDEQNEREGHLKYIDATKDGKCQCCFESYKKGDRIALYKHESGDSYSPYHSGCMDEVLLAAKEAAEKNRA